LLDSFPQPRRLLVQWVPHGYGYHSMNIFFCLWLWARARMKRDKVEIMFHEVWLSFGISWKANVAAAVHRLMVMLLKRAASKMWISGESWRKFLSGAKVPIRWLPVPSSIPAGAEPQEVATVRKRYCDDKKFLVGQFGIGSSLVRNLLREFIPVLLRDRGDVTFLLIGKGSQEFAQELYQECPDIRDRVFYTGLLSSQKIAAHVSACDLIAQLYPDGISTRRTSAMSALCNGRPLLTTSGHSTEPFWSSCGQIALAPTGNVGALIARAKQLLQDEEERERMAAGGRELYQNLFDVSVLVQVLRGNRAPLQQQSIVAAISCGKV
jgi:glycosyltransferase involved in cell wall biosynthesis